MSQIEFRARLLIGLSYEQLSSPARTVFIRDSVTEIKLPHSGTESELK
jgi:hypothetical protein